MNVFEARFGSLPLAQRLLIPELRAVSELGFVLYGGTALALRFEHRESVDFDFFNDAHLDRARLLGLSLLKDAQVIQDEPDTITAIVRREADPVKVSFFGDISFGRVGSPEMTNDGNLQVASIDDLFATKLKLLLQRVEVKDYQDIVALLKDRASLERGLAAAKSLYGKAFQPSESLRALAYFEGGNLDELTPDQRRFLERSVSRCRSLPLVPIVSRQLSGLSCEQS